MFVSGEHFIITQTSQYYGQQFVGPGQESSGKPECSQQSCKNRDTVTRVDANRAREDARRQDTYIPKGSAAEYLQLKLLLEVFMCRLHDRRETTTTTTIKQQQQQQQHISTGHLP